MVVYNGTVNLDQFSVLYEMVVRYAAEWNGPIDRVGDLISFSVIVPDENETAFYNELLSKFNVPKTRSLAQRFIDYIHGK